MPVAGSRNSFTDRTAPNSANVVAIIFSVAEDGRLLTQSAALTFCFQVVERRRRCPAVSSVRGIPSGCLDFVPIRRSVATLYERWRTEPAGLFSVTFRAQKRSCGPVLAQHCVAGFGDMKWVNLGSRKAFTR
jgi:hypothetical protein